MRNLRQHQAGIGLVEILVAMTIGLILMAGVFQIFQGNRTTYQISEALARVQENGRFAMLFLSRDLRMAGYTGCSRDTAMTSTLNAGVNDYVFDFNSYLSGHSDPDKNGSWSPALPGGVASVLKGTDVVTVRAAEGSGTQIQEPYMNDTAAALHVTTGNGLKVGDIVVVSDCTMSTVFQVTNNNPDTSGTVVHNTGNTAPGNSTKDLGKTYKGDAELMRIATTSYFLRKNPAGQPALYRRIGADPAEELVEGVDDLQILYGIDTNADGAVDGYEAASATLDWDNVVSVQISLRVRSREDNVVAEATTVSYDGANVTDRRLRQTFTSTIGIRNRLR